MIGEHELPLGVATSIRQWLALASSVVDRMFDSWLGRNKNYKICMCYFSAKHGDIRSNSKG
jgi:hypothetical protein